MDQNHGRATAAPLKTKGESRQSPIL